MAPNRHTQLANLLLGLLPADHTTVGNITLLAQFLAAAHTHGTQSPATEADFKQAREALVASGQAIKGKGRGGATAKAMGPERPAFALQAQATPVPLFIADAYRTVAVKIVDDRRIESLKLMKLEGAH